MVHHTKFHRFPVTCTECLACGTGPFLPIPSFGRRTCSADNIGTAAPLPDPIIREGHRLSSLIRITVALQFCRQSGHKLSSLIQVTATYRPRSHMGLVLAQKPCRLPCPDASRGANEPSNPHWTCSRRPAAPRRFPEEPMPRQPATP